jgi:hypothetical protein
MVGMKTSKVNVHMEGHKKLVDVVKVEIFSKDDHEDIASTTIIDSFWEAKT